MKLTADHPYQASVDQVYRYFRDPALVIAKYQALGHREVTVIHSDESDEGYLSCVERQVPADVPALLKALLGSYNQVRQTEQWFSYDDGSLGCELKVEISGVPVAISGNMQLYEEGQGCINHIELTISSSLPLIGSALVNFIAGDSEKAMSAEYAYISSQLAEDNSNG